MYPIKQYNKKHLNKQYYLIFVNIGSRVRGNIGGSWFIEKLKDWELV